MSRSLLMLFAGWATVLLFGIPGVALMFRYPSRAKVLGWLTFATGLAQVGYFLFCPVSPYRLSSSFSRSSDVLHITLWAVPPIFIGLIAVIGSGVIKRRNPVYNGPKCVKCGYLLVGNLSGKCPECSNEISNIQFEFIQSLAQPNYSEATAVPAIPVRDRRSGIVRRIVLAIAVGGPLSVIGFVCGALSVHAGDFFLIPHIVLCPFTSLFYLGVGQLPIFLRKAVSEGTSRFELVAIFCLLQFLYYYLLFCTVDWARNRVASGEVARPLRTKVRSSRRRFVLGGTLAVAAFGVAFALYANRGIPFDSVAWIKMSESERGRMTDELVRSGRLIGHSPSQVLELLGAPAEHYFSYNSGDGRLVIDLDQQGRYRARFIPPRPLPAIAVESFSSKEWREKAPKDRLPMAISLNSQPQFFSSRTYDEIIKELGPPSEDDEAIAYHVGRWGRLFLWIKEHRVKGVYQQ